ncbi:TfoX/Sxy family protein [soil metagenome]
MAYDHELAERIRRLLDESGHDAVERKMFGGLAFMVNDRMAVVASGRGGLMARVADSIAEELVETTPATVAEMRGRPMKGWLRIPSDHVSTTQALKPWVLRAMAHAEAQPRRS